MEARLSTEMESFGARLKKAVLLAGGVPHVSSVMERGQSTFYTWFKETSSPPVADVQRICQLAGVRPAWVFTGEGAMREGEAAPSASASGSGEDSEVVNIPILTAPASAGAGTILTEGPEEQGSVPFPRIWARSFGTPSRLRLVEIVGESMKPDLEEGDWMMINLDLRELRDGVALVRLDDALMVKRLQPQGRMVMLTSSNPVYLPISLDLEKDGDRFAIIGHAKWKCKKVS